jgi:hypothetical protein
MLRNLSAKSSIYVALLHAGRTRYRSTAGTGEETRGGRDQLAMPGRRRSGWSILHADVLEREDDPHTVPNSPMNGVMLAVVARNGTRFSSLPTSALVARSSADRPTRGFSRWTRAAPPAGLVGILVAELGFSSA